MVVVECQMSNSSAIWWREQVTFSEMIMPACFVLDLHTGYTSSQVDMFLHLDTLSWFWTNLSLLLLLNAAWFAEKQQLPKSLIWPYLGLNPQSITLYMSMQTITLSMLFKFHRNMYLIYFRPNLHCNFNLNKDWLAYGVLTPLSTIFQLYRGG